MSCHQFDDQIWEAAETGELPPALAEHVQHCPACRQAYASTTAAVQGLAGLRAVAAPDPRAAIAGRLVQPRPNISLRLLLAGGLAAAVLCLTLLAYRLLPSPDGSQSVRTPDPAPKPVVIMPELPDPSPPRVRQVQPPAPAPAPVPPRVRKPPVQRPQPVIAREPVQQPEQIVVSELELPCLQSASLVAPIAPRIQVDYPEVSPGVGDPTYCAQAEPVRVSVTPPSPPASVEMGTHDAAL